MGGSLQQIFVALFKLSLNVELCMSISSIKYVLKYVHKGCNQATFALRSDQIDKISEYQNARYVSSNEAVWRILEFTTHERFTAVWQLSVHLENGQRVCFTHRRWQVPHWWWQHWCCSVTQDSWYICLFHWRVDVYVDLLFNFKNITWLSECCILAPLNKTTRTINATLVEQLPGECIEYNSLDSVPDKSQAVEFSTEFLNSL